ncbi:MAG TPA: GerMN domain-containing protein [Clostridia bacterium]|nr:GerMN domain-containing protein [Clostridia bacterium]
MRKLCLLLVAVLLFTSGCTIGNQMKKESVKLYYALKGNTGLDIENRDIEYKANESKYAKTLEELLKGPDDSDRFETSINRDTKVLAAEEENGSLTVNFSKEFNVFSGSMHEGAVVASVVDTMLQFAELKKVRILVEGQELIAPSGEPYGYMEFIDFNTADLSEREITLYFSDSQAMYLVPEKRTILVKNDISETELYRLVLEELIKGPASENLYRTIPEEVRIEYLELDGEVLKVDFSEEMHTKHWHGAAGEEMTVNSLANTMTEFEDIKGVMPTVDGGPLSIEHMVVEEPLTRNESIIYRQ